MSTFEDTVVESSGAPGRTGNNGTAVADAITPDGRPAPIARARGARAMQDTPATGPLSHAIDPMPSNNSGPSGARVIKDSTREMIAKLAKAGRDTEDDDPDEPDDVEVVADDPDEPDDDSTAAKAAPAKEPPKAAPPSEWEKERDELKALADRQRSIIERLRADSAKAPPANDYEARLKRLDEAEETYVRSPVDAFKSWLAATNSLEPGSPEFEQEFRDIYIDLTSAITSAEAEASHQAKRSSALIRREWDRTNKKRQADEQRKQEPTAQSEQGKRLETATEIVRGHYKSIAEEHPYLNAMAQEFDGKSAETLVAELVLHGIETGDFGRDELDDVLTKKAAKLANEHYKRRWDALSAKAPSTAKPDAGTTPAADATDAREKARQGKGTRVTNADASVAPAAPPATKPSEPAPRKFRDDDEKKRFLIRKHLGKR